MSEKTGKKITLIIDEVEFNFSVGLVDFNLFANSYSDDNKTTPSTIFLRTTVSQENKDALNALIEDGQCIVLAQSLIAEFRPKIEITVKK